MEHWNWQHERELSRSRPGQREELCLELCQVFICVQRFETNGEYSGAFLEQVITTNFVTADDFFGQRNISQALNVTVHVYLRGASFFAPFSEHCDCTENLVMLTLVKIC